MDDHFYNSDPSSQRWSVLRRSDDDPLEGPSTYREIESRFHYDARKDQESRSESVLKHRDSDPMEGPSNYRKVEDQFRYRSGASELNQQESFTKRRHDVPTEDRLREQGLQSRFSSWTTTTPQSHPSSTNQDNVNNETLAALEGNRGVAWLPDQDSNGITTVPQSPTDSEDPDRKRSRQQRFSQHISQFRLSKPSTWLPVRSNSEESLDHNPPAPLSNDPNDPQNWPEPSKKQTYLTICLFSFLANINASAFTVATRSLMTTFHISPTSATALTALNVLTFGLGNLIWVPAMRVLGKRPVYLIAIAVLVGTNIWSALAGSYGSLLAARMLSGLGAAAADATVPSVVEDLWAGRRKAQHLMWFSGALASGIFLGPLVNAWVVERHGWRWTPGWLAPAFAGMFVMAFFCVRETTYKIERRHWRADQVPVPRRFKEWIGFGAGRERVKGVGQVVGRTLRDIVGMTGYVQVLWASCLIGVIVGWTIIIQITAGQVFTRLAVQGGKYHWRLGLVGVFHISGWLGAIIAGRLGGRFADHLAFRAQRKRGLQIRRSKYRMQSLAFFSICPFGLIIYGVCVAKTTIWVGPAFGYAIHSFGFAAIANIGITYVVDCFGELASEALVSLFIIRNIIGVICSFYCNPWIDRDGMPAAFGTMAALEWALLACALPIFLFHERLLAWTRTYGPAQRLPQPTHQHGDNIELQILHPPRVESV